MHLLFFVLQKFNYSSFITVTCKSCDQYCSKSYRSLRLHDSFCAEKPGLPGHLDCLLLGPLLRGQGAGCPSKGDTSNIHPPSFNTLILSVNIMVLVYQWQLQSFKIYLETVFVWIFLKYEKCSSSTLCGCQSVTNRTSLITSPSPQMQDDHSSSLVSRELLSGSGPLPDNSNARYLAPASWTGPDTDIYASSGPGLGPG